jgi:hypothetical protein
LSCSWPYSVPLSPNQPFHVHNGIRPVRSPSTLVQSGTSRNLGKFGPPSPYR